MYVVAGKFDNTIFGMGKKLGQLDNGYPTLIDKNMAWVTDDVNIYEIDLVPEYVTEFDYCYTPEQGFYPNPNQKSPSEEYYGVDPVIVEQIQTDYRERLAKEVAEYGYDA